MACQRPLYQPMAQCALAPILCVAVALSLSTTPLTTSTLFHLLPAEARSTGSTQQAAEHPVCQCPSPCTQHGIQSGCGVTASARGECLAKNGADGLSMQPPPIPNACFPVRKAFFGCGSSDQQSCQLSLQHMRAAVCP